MSQGTDCLKKPVVILKIIELALCLICIGIDSTSLFGTSIIRQHFVSGTFVGFFLVGWVLLLSYLVGTPLKKELVMFVLGVAAIMFLTAAAVLFDDYVTGRRADSDLAKAMGAMAVINFVVYAADVGVTYKMADLSPTT